MMKEELVVSLGATVGIIAFVGFATLISGPNVAQDPFSIPAEAASRIEEEKEDPDAPAINVEDVVEDQQSRRNEPIDRPETPYIFAASTPAIEEPATQPQSAVAADVPDPAEPQPTRDPAPTADSSNNAIHYASAESDNWDDDGTEDDWDEDWDDDQDDDNKDDDNKSDKQNPSVANKRRVAEKKAARNNR